MENEKSKLRMPKRIGRPPMTQEKKQAIKEALLMGYVQSSIAAEYDVTQSTVSSIRQEMVANGEIK